MPCKALFRLAKEPSDELILIAWWTKLVDNCHEFDWIVLLEVSEELRWNDLLEYLLLTVNVQWVLQFEGDWVEDL